MSKYYGYHEFQNDRHVADASVIGLHTNENIRALRKEFPEGDFKTYSAVEDAVADMYVGPDSIDVRLEGKDKEDALKHIDLMNDNFHLSYREYLLEQPDMVDADLVAQAKYYEMDDFYKKLLTPGYGDFDPTKDKDAFRSFGQDIKAYKEHLVNDDFTKYPFTDNYRYFAVAKENFATGINRFMKNYDQYGYNDAVDNEDDAFGQTMQTLGSVDELDQLYENVVESFDTSFDEPMEPELVSTPLVEDLPAVIVASQKPSFDFGRDVSVQEPLKKPMTHQDLNKNNRELLTDEEFSEMLREEQELADLNRGESKKRPAGTIDGFKPNGERRLPGGYVKQNGFKENENGELVDDGFSYDESYKDSEFDN